MPEEQIENEIKEFLEYYQGKEIPSPEHEPIRFAAWVRDFRYAKSRNFSYTNNS